MDLFSSLSRWRERFDSARERHKNQSLSALLRRCVQHLANIRVWTLGADVALLLYAIALFLLGFVVLTCVLWPAWIADQKGRCRALVEALSGNTD